MTFQIFKQFAAIVVFVFVGVVNIKAQQPSADDMLNLVAKLQRLEAMQPDSIGPKYCTLRGFLYMVRIVQNPAQNGQRYYMDVMQNYEKALRLNPNNALAQQLQQKFLEGMKQHTN